MSWNQEIENPSKSVVIGRCGRGEKNTDKRRTLKIQKTTTYKVLRLLSGPS